MCCNLLENYLFLLQISALAAGRSRIAVVWMSIKGERVFTEFTFVWFFNCRVVTADVNSDSRCFISSTYVTYVVHMTLALVSCNWNKRFEIVTFCKTFALLKFWGRVDGQMINVLTFYFPLTPTVSVKFVFEKSENKQNKRPG